MNSWPVLVTIHNVGRVPKEVATLSKPGLRFRVSVSVVGADTSSTAQLARACPEVSSTFEPKDVQLIQDSHYEVKLDGTSGSGRGSLEWASPRPVVDVIVSVKEEDASDSSKTIAAATAFPVDLSEIIEKRKLRTLVIGTSMGQVGISIAVAPSDTAGYRRRLEAFLNEHNKAGLKLLSNVVAQVSEVDTFTKVNKKYNLVDYSKRVKRFFSTYGGDQMHQWETVLKQWENKEEELMRNLILDNGPELCDVDLKQRLTAFAKKYKIPPLEFDVSELMRLHAANPEPLFEGLVAKYGPEPDPRTYLFGPTYYGEKPPESPRRSTSERKSSSANFGGGNLNSSTSGTYSSKAPAANNQAANSSSNDAFGAYYASTVFEPEQQQQPNSTSPLPPSVSAQQVARANSIAESYLAQQRQSTATPFDSAKGAGGAAVSFADAERNHSISSSAQPAASSFYGGAKNPPSNASVTSSAYSAPAVSSSYQQQPSSNAAAASTNIVELWSTLSDDLRSASIPLAELHYLNEASFLSLLSELGYSSAAKQLLTAEWHRRVSASLRMEQLSHGDSLFEAAKRDVITISGLHPLNINVVGVTLLKNAEHESSFSLRLGEAKLRTTERLILVGEHHRLMAYATNGVSQQPHLAASQPATVFNRKPFYAIQRPSSVSVLVCDVVIGKPFIGSASASSTSGEGALTAPREGTPSFLKEFDSCVFYDPLAGQSVAVYQPQQVLAKYLVQCNVDTTISPCPAHPSRAVEFFVVEANVFACSQCVVMGQYRGKEVMTVEDATLQARSQLQDMQRDVLHVVSEMAAVEADCDRQLQGLQHTEFRLNANRQIEMIRREAEQRIAALQLELESYERQRRDAVVDSKSQARRVLEDAQSVATQLDDGLRNKGASETISLLINTRRGGLIENIRDRAASVRSQGAGDGAGAAPLSSGAQPTLDRLAPLQTTAASSASLFRSARSNISAGVMPQLGNVSAAFGAHDSPSVELMNSGLNRTPRSGAAVPSAPQAPSDASALYSKFLNIKQQASSLPMQGSAASFLQQQQQQASTSTLDTSFAAKSAVKAASELEAKRMKDLITTGWAEFRKGDRNAAHKIWQDVYERNANNAIGARAKAYISEAIEKNYQSAAQWYEKALSYDPQDCLTLYNYGVLLESVLDRKRDALQLFETAQRYGDSTAGKRAAQLRQSMLLVQ